MFMAPQKRQREEDAEPRTFVYRCSINHPPEFWDSLSQVFLTRRALRELNRRNNVNSFCRSKAEAPDVVRLTTRRGPLTRGALRELRRRSSVKSVAWSKTKTKALASDLVKFAKHGGPNLSNLRGFPDPEDTAVVMAPKSSRTQQKGRPSQTSVTEDSAKNVRSSAYDDNFEQHYIDNSVYPVDYDYGDVSPYPEPNNLSDIRAAMAVPRASLSQVTPEQFRSFRMKNNTESEGTVMCTIIPTITGETKIPNEGHLPFTNLTSMTEEATVKPVPDFWDGVRRQDLHKSIRDHGDLSKKLIPTKHRVAPVAPNFFLEAKALKGGMEVARRQAMADGAYGARSMHSVQNHGLNEPVYDGNAYTYSSTYHSGNLKLYSHHPTAPTATGDKPRYHMTQLGGYDMTHSSDMYREATTALRNTRDLAQQQRNELIQAANARVTQLDQVYDGVSVPEDYNTPIPQSVGYSTFRHLATEGNQQGRNSALLSFHSAEEPASFTTSFTSPTDPYEVESPSKRVSAQSPPSANTRSKKSASEKRRARRNPG